MRTRGTGAAFQPGETVQHPRLAEHVTVADRLEAGRRKLQDQVLLNVGGLQPRRVGEAGHATLEPAYVVHLGPRPRAVGDRGRPRGDVPVSEFAYRHSTTLGGCPGPDNASQAPGWRDRQPDLGAHRPARATAE